MTIMSWLRGQGRSSRQWSSSKLHRLPVGDLNAWGAVACFFMTEAPEEWGVMVRAFERAKRSWWHMPVMPPLGRVPEPLAWAWRHQRPDFLDDLVRMRLVQPDDLKACLEGASIGLVCPEQLAKWLGRADVQERVRMCSHDNMTLTQALANVGREHSFLHKQRQHLPLLVEHLEELCHEEIRHAMMQRGRAVLYFGGERIPITPHGHMSMARALWLMNDQAWLLATLMAPFLDVHACVMGMLKENMTEVAGWLMPFADDATLVEVADHYHVGWDEQIQVKTERALLARGVANTAGARTTRRTSKL